MAVGNGSEGKGLGGEGSQEWGLRGSFSNCPVIQTDHKKSNHSHCAQIPGSYLVRQQDGDLKYIVAFSSSEVSGCDRGREGQSPEV